MRSVVSPLFIMSFYNSSIVEEQGRISSSTLYVGRETGKGGQRNQHMRLARSTASLLSVLMIAGSLVENKMGFLFSARQMQAIRAITLILIW